MILVRKYHFFACAPNTKLVTLVAHRGRPLVALWCEFDNDETVKLTGSKITDLPSWLKIATAQTRNCLKIKKN